MVADIAFKLFNLVQKAYSMYERYKARNDERKGLARCAAAGASIVLFSLKPQQAWFRYPPVIDIIALCFIGLPCAKQRVHALFVMCILNIHVTHRLRKRLRGRASAQALLSALASTLRQLVT